MFKIAKLEDVNNEKTVISLGSQTHCGYNNGKKEKVENFNTLCFDISGDNYMLGFELNCKLEKLLDIPMYETINFNKYILEGETWLNINGLNGIEPIIEFEITRYLENRFAIFLTFYTDYSYDNKDYMGMAEITFNLDDYLK